MPKIWYAVVRRLLNHRARLLHLYSIQHLQKRSLHEPVHKDLANRLERVSLFLLRSHQVRHWTIECDTQLIADRRFRRPDAQSPFSRSEESATVRDLLHHLYEIHDLGSELYVTSRCSRERLQMALDGEILASEVGVSFYANNGVVTDICSWL